MNTNENNHEVNFVPITSGALVVLLEREYERGRMSVLEQNSVVTPTELAKQAKVTLQTIRSWQSRGLLPHKNVVGGWSKHVIDDMMNMSELEYKRKYKLL